MIVGRGTLPLVKPGDMITAGGENRIRGALNALAMSGGPGTFVHGGGIQHRPMPGIQTETLVWLISWAAWGATEKRFKYGWEEIKFDDAGTVVAVTDGLSGTTSVDYIINLKELNNTIGTTSAQGNSMELVAPLGLGTGGTPSHKVICLMKTLVSSDGTVQRIVDVPNSDHIEEDDMNKIVLGEWPVAPLDENHGDGENENADAYDLDTDQTGLSSQGKPVELVGDLRFNYDHLNDSVLRSFARYIRFKPNGKMELIVGEDTITNDEPENC